MASKIRLDQLLVKRGLVDTRQKAKALIMEGKVFLQEERAEKAGEMVEENASLQIKETLRYVSRGGLKLEKAWSVFDLDVKGKICLDIGASTGGFTDCMLQNGAAKVYAVDVGYGQLAWKLRKDPRVILLERTNARYLTPEMVPETVDFFTVDVSFISLTKILPAALPLLREEGYAVLLIKPQFEAGKDQVGKKGVVRDKKVHAQVLSSIYETCLALECSILGMDYSPIRGPQGNIEYLYWLKKTRIHPSMAIESIEPLVEKAHNSFAKQGIE